MNRVLLALVMLMGFATASRGSTVQFITKTDANGCLSGAMPCAVQSTISNQILGIGDAVDYTVTFAEKQHLALTDPAGDGVFSFPFLGGAAEPGQFTITGAIAGLLGLQGDVSKPRTLPDLTRGDAQMTPAFSDAIPMSDTISFIGYQIQFQVTGLPARVNTGSSSETMAETSDIAVDSDVTATPELGNLALIGAGVLGSGVLALVARYARPRRRGGRQAY